MEHLTGQNAALDRRAQKLMDDAEKIFGTETEPTYEEYMKAMSFMELAHKMKMKIYGGELPMHDAGGINLFKAQCLTGTKQYEEAILLYQENYRMMEPVKKHYKELFFLRTCYMEREGQFFRLPKNSH